MADTKGRLTFKLEDRVWVASFVIEDRPDERIVVGTLNVEHITPLHKKGVDTEIDHAIECVKVNFVRTMRASVSLMGMIRDREFEWQGSETKTDNSKLN